MFATVRFTTDLGAEVHVPVPLPEDAKPWQVEDAILDAMRRFGRRGWRATQTPPGGYHFPLSVHDQFDWALIGGSRGRKRFDGEDVDREGVWVGGDFYSRRDYAETQPTRGKAGLPAAIRYSRGARPTDPPELREKGDGDFEYVTLVNFRGGGAPRKKLALPSGTPTSAEREDEADIAADVAAPTSDPATQEPGFDESSVLDTLESTPAHLKAALDFIRDSAGKFDAATTIAIAGQEQNLRAYVRSHWETIKADFALAVAVARRLETATGRRFQIPAGV